MIKTFLYLIALSFLYTSVSAQWEYSNPQPSGYGNTKVVFTNNDTGYILNYNGDLIQTGDGGNNWRIIRNFPFAKVLEVKDSTGIISDHFGLLISTDNGVTWNRKSGLTSVLRIHIASRDSLFAVTTMNNLMEELYKSTDRGITWQKVNLPVNTLKGEAFLNSKNGFICSHTGIFRTQDAGVTWEHVDSTYNTAQPAPIRFVDTRNGFAYNSEGMLRTADGGKTWTNSPGVFQEINDIFYLDQQTAFAASDNNVVFKTVDKGASWAYYSASTASDGYGLYSLYFLNDNNGFAVGNRGRILKTTNGGITWQQYAASYIDIMGLSLPTAETGYAITWYDLLKTTDAGKTWDKMPFKSPQSDWFRFLHFFNRDTGIIIKDKPFRIHRTTNGGATWDTTDLRSQGLLYYDNYSSGHVVNDIIYLMATGPSPTAILRSKDQGKTWEALSNIYPGNYQNLHFVSGKTGYGTMASSLFKTEDSGRTWNRIPLTDYSYLNSIWFIDEKTGFAVGDNAFLIQTRDSGKTWNRITINNNNNGRNNTKVKFFNAQVGYITQQQAVILVTVDSGRTWLQHGSPAASDCRLIEFSKDSVIYLAGLSGAIVKRKMATHQVDSFFIQSNASCRLTLSARVTAIFSTVDSIFFEYGVTGYNNIIKASSAGVENASIKVSATTADLVGGSNYRFRVKTYYQGKIYYSDTLTFLTGVMVTKPVISVTGNILRSSVATGNQWYLNGAPISGATGQQYTVTQVGVYAVSVTQNGCTVVSDDYNFITTGITDPSAWNGEVLVYPNPTGDWLRITNTSNRNLLIRMIDIHGRTIYNATSTSNHNINMQRFAKGNYILLVTDKKKNETLRKVVIKE